jgi:hypothetical protein
LKFYWNKDKKITPKNTQNEKTDILSSDPVEFNVKEYSVTDYFISDI